MVCPCCASNENQCCCAEDGSVYVLNENNTCTGQTISFSDAACNWDGVTMTFTVDGLSATAPAEDWHSGNEPEFVAGLGSGNLPNNKYFDTVGYKGCTCGVRWIYLDINYTGCLGTLRINECTNDAVTTGGCAFEVSVNWAP